jgi:hypothetical protein
VEVKDRGRKKDEREGKVAVRETSDIKLMHGSEGKSLLMVMIELMDAFHLPSYLMLKIRHNWHLSY